jgi:hypothetical protein
MTVFAREGITTMSEVFAVSNGRRHVIERVKEVLNERSIDAKQTNTVRSE